MQLPLRRSVSQKVLRIKPSTNPKGLALMKLNKMGKSFIILIFNRETLNMGLIGEIKVTKVHEREE